MITSIFIEVFRILHLLFPIFFLVTVFLFLISVSFFFVEIFRLLWFCILPDASSGVSSSDESYELQDLSSLSSV